MGEMRRSHHQPQGLGGGAGAPMRAGPPGQLLSLEAGNKPSLCERGVSACWPVGGGGTPPPRGLVEGCGSLPAPLPAAGPRTEGLSGPGRRMQRPSRCNHWDLPGQPPTRARSHNRRRLPVLQRPDPNVHREMTLPPTAVWETPSGADLPAHTRETRGRGPRHAAPAQAHAPPPPPPAMTAREVRPSIRPTGKDSI